MPHSEPRRPRFERAAVPRIALTARDVEILRAVHRHRLLRSTHVVTLFGGRRQTILRRMQLLFHHGYLDRPVIQLDWYTRASEPLVYALGKRGAAVLSAAGEKTRGGVRWDTKNRNLSRVFLHHTLAVAEVMVAFEDACRDHPRVQLIGPEEILAKAPPNTRRLALPFRWQADVRVKGETVRLGIEPDKVFGLRFEDATASRGQVFFFLEADRGTMPVVRKGLVQTSFARKLLAYEATWRQRLHTGHLGIPNFRVLTVTTGDERLRHLVTASRALGRGTSGVFLFTTPERLTLGGALGASWINGRAESNVLVAA